MYLACINFIHLHICLYCMHMHTPHKSTFATGSHPNTLSGDGIVVVDTDYCLTVLDFENMHTLSAFLYIIQSADEPKRLKKFEIETLLS